jgi:hypothetical protein
LRFFFPREYAAHAPFIVRLSLVSAMPEGQKPVGGTLFHRLLL